MESDRRAFLAGAGALAAGLLGQCRTPGTTPAAGGDRWTRARAGIPLAPDLAYFNTGGLGPAPGPVLEAVRRSTRELAATGETGHHLVERIRRKAAAFLGCRERELGFTRSATESMNHIARGLPLQEGDQVLLTTHEHPGGAIPWFTLARDLKLRVESVEPHTDPGILLDRLEKLRTPRTRVVSLSHITCTTGALLPVREVAAWCRGRGLLAVVDGAQALGQVPVRPRELGCDAYAASGHKWLLGPRGTGLLWLREEMLDRWRPCFGGAYVDREFDLGSGRLETIAAARAVEYGTRNIPLLVGLGEAFRLVRRLGPEAIARRGAALAARCRRLLEDAGYRILTPAPAGSITTFVPRRATADPGALASRLRREHRVRVRPVTEAGLRGLRVSTHWFNTEEELDRLLAALRREEG